MVDVARITQIYKDGLEDLDQQEANAQLIATSPELLRALIEAKKVLDERCEFYNFMSFIEKTIKKATT